MAPSAGPGSRQTRGDGGAAQAAPGWMAVPPLWEVIQDAHLTRPLVGVKGAANNVAPPLHQHVAVLGVYRDGQQYTGEVNPTVLLTLAVGRAGVVPPVPRQGCGRV